MKTLYFRFLEKFNLTQVAKIIIFSTIVGIIAGLGAVLFYFLIKLVSHYALVEFCGYKFAKVFGEKELFNPSHIPEFTRWKFLIVPTIGGLISGLIVYTFAPEAEGHGTDSVIETIHKKNSRFKLSIPFIKTIASAITIGTGGSGGREGPIAQIGASISAILAKYLKLSDYEIRIAACCGMGAGIGAIFKSPLAGAIFGVEVLYRSSDMEYEALVPGIISAIIAYSVFCIFYGFSPMFITQPVKFISPMELIPYTLLGLICSVFGIFYVKAFYGVRDIFKKINIPDHFKPAIGGFLTGVLAFLIPQVISTDYGQIQNMFFEPNYALWFLFILIVFKILATSFSIGSGGSGGIFGPAIFIGASVGTFSGEIFKILFPNLIVHPSSYTIVGMAGFFAGIAHTPISTLLIVSELTGNYNLLVPTMWVCAITFILCRNYTIYEKQVFSRFDSPVHKKEYLMSILEEIKVGDIMVKNPETIPENMVFKDILEYIPKTKFTIFPVVNSKGELIGIISFHNIRDIVFEEGLENLVVAKDLVDEKTEKIYPDSNLMEAVEKFGMSESDMLPVVDKKDPKKLLGIITRKDIMKAYNEHAKEHKKLIEEKKQKEFI